MASPASEPVLHLCLLPLLKPTGGVRKRGHPPGRISQYDGEIIRYNNQHYLPSRIAELLCQEHGLDPAMMNRKSVERRLRTIKTKCYKMAIDAVFSALSYGPKICMYNFRYLYFSRKWESHLCQLLPVFFFFPLYLLFCLFLLCLAASLCHLLFFLCCVCGS